MKATKLQFGVAVPWFEARSPNNPRYHFDTVAGRHVVLSFLGSVKHAASRQVMDDVLARLDVFNADRAAFFAVSIDPEDESSGRLREALPGVRVLWDFDRKLSRMFGALSRVEDRPEVYRRFSVVLDERLRVFTVVPLAAPLEGHVPLLLEAPPLAASPSYAPVLSIPRVFEPGLCQALIRYYEQLGGGESGFMLDIDGKTVGVYDHKYKRRRDQEIKDEALRTACMVRIHDRVVPEIAKAFQFLQEGPQVSKKAPS